VFPNANASGYYRFSLTPKDLAQLRLRGLPRLSPRERTAFGNSLRAGFNRQTLSFKDSLLAAAALANDARADVAGEPMSYVSLARDWLYADPLRASVEAYGRTLFDAAYAHLGWTPAKGEDSDRVQLRSRVIGFLALTAKDPIVRAEAQKRGLAFLGQGSDGAIHREALDSNLVGIALSVVGEEADAALWDSVKARLAKTDDAVLRGWFLAVLQSTEKPELVARVRALPFDPVLRATEVTTPVWSEMREPALRRDTWQWVKANFDRLLDTVPKHHGQTQLISMGGELCDEADRQDVEAFFTTERLAKIDGGPRVLAGVLEDIHLCATKRSAQEVSARELFGKGK
jgi:alanyl aminopeptidase